jgi:bifunctional UDP-N-acetylglucosamine pyrophosphorylase/glucosamine-1-phosphate N-acetyltransferase
VQDPGAYGRVIKEQSGWLSRIVEARDATEEELLIDEINSGIYVSDSQKLFESVADLKPLNNQKEYYLTDVAADFRSRGLLVAAVEGPDPLEVQGINDRSELAFAQATLRSRINYSWLLAGVTMADPNTAYIESSVRLSQDVTLGLGVILTGNTKVGQGAVIGHYSCLDDVEIEPGAVLAAYSSQKGGKISSQTLGPSKAAGSAKISAAPKAKTKTKTIPLKKAP